MYICTKTACVFRYVCTMFMFIFMYVFQDGVGVGVGRIAKGDES